MKKKTNNYKNAGRKPLEKSEKKRVVRIWLQESKINTLGGDEGVQSLIYDTVKEALQTA